MFLNFIFAEKHGTHNILEKVHITPPPQDKDIVKGNPLYFFGVPFFDRRKVGIPKHT